MREFLAESLVRLDHAYHSHSTHRERLHPPRAIPQREQHREDHRRQTAQDQNTLPLSLCPVPEYRLDDHHIAPRQPQRYPARAGNIRPLHEDRGICERRSEPKPWEPDVSEMADEPLERRPRDG